MRAPRRQRGLVLLALLVILTIGSLYLFLGNLSPAIADAQRARRTEAALAEAREALLGYAMRYRDLQAAQDLDSDGNDDRAMYGYLPLPDLGSSRNGNVDCVGLEGCEAGRNISFPDLASTYDPNGLPPTIVGRFPWWTLGTSPLKDGNGECLWLIVSSSHGRIHRSFPDPTPPAMNWDTPGQLEVVVANGTAELRNALALPNRSLHQRPIAVVFAPGPVLPGQDRSAGAAPPAGDNVTECGGNYDAKNYLEWMSAVIDDGTVAERTVVTNPFGTTTNTAAAHTFPVPLDPLPTQRDRSYPVHFSGDIALNAGVFVSQRCPNCTSNDQGLAVTPDQLFARLGSGSAFIGDINAMLDRIESCLKLQIDNGIPITPSPIAGFVPAGSAQGGRVPNACLVDTQDPKGYFSNWKDMFFLAKPGAAFTVNGAACDGWALLFAGQRSAAQRRYYQYFAPETDFTALPENYLEGSNLDAFNDLKVAMPTALAFRGGTEAVRRTPLAPPPSADIVRCVPTSAGTGGLAPIVNPALTSGQQLATYDPSTRTLTLGRQDIDTAHGFPVAALFGCAWQPAAHALGEGLRSYFRFSFATLGTSVGNTGFVFAMIDGESNTGSPCGAAGSMLGYGGDNTYTPLAAPPKLGIEFDQSRNSGYTESSATFNFGRRDPCGSFFCGGTYGYDTHAAIVYWGHELANATDGVIDPLMDDNVHGHPSSGSLVTLRKPPTSPSDIAAAAPGIAMINLRTGGDVFHVRVEVTPTRVTAPWGDVGTECRDTPKAECNKTRVVTKAWVLKDSATDANRIAAMKNTTRPMTLLDAGFGPTISDVAQMYDVKRFPSCDANGKCPGPDRARLFATVAPYNHIQCTAPPNNCPATGVCGGIETDGQRYCYTELYACGSDNACYGAAMDRVRLGFTNSQRSQDQQITITDLFTTWLQ